MSSKHLESRPNMFRFMQLNNLTDGPTHPVSVDYSFLTEMFAQERAYSEDSPIMYRKKSHPVRNSHITGMSIRLMMTIFRRFNTEGSLVGVPIHRLYLLMNEEYEKKASKEQFYAEVQKFINLGLISVTSDGIVKEWKIEAFKRKTGRFVLFNPLVFSEKFTDLEIAAQKLYLYIVSRNGDKVKHEFKESIGSDRWINTLTHKTRPSQIRDLLKNLSTIEPILGQPLLLHYDVKKDSLGNWSLICTLNPSYLVKHTEGSLYRLIPKAKIPYSKTVHRLRMLVKYYNIGEVEHIENGLGFLELTKLFKNVGIKTMRYAINRLKEMIVKSGFVNISDMVHALKVELQDRKIISYIDILKRTKVYNYLGIDENDVLDNARPLQFFRAIRNIIPLTNFKNICCRALPILQERFGEELNTNFLSSQSSLNITNRFSHETFFLEDLLITLA